MAAVVELPKPHELADDANLLSAEARSIAVVDQQSYDRAADKLRGVAALRHKIQEHYAPLKQKAHEAHRAICAAESEMLQPVADAEKVLKSSIGSYELEQRRKQAELDRLAREEAERIAAEIQEQQIEQAEAAGASIEEIAAICEAPVIAPVPVVAPVHTAAKGVGAREIYSAEVFDLRALCREIAEGRQASSLVVPNQTALNGMARALKANLKIPGVRVVAQSSVSVRR